MKNIFKVFACVALTGALALSVSSCSESFLDEVSTDGVTSDYLETPQGLYSMSESLYIQFRQMYYAEGYWAFTQTGTDEFMIGGDGASEAYNTYDARYAARITGSANTADSAYMWNMFYTWLNRANKLIDKEDVLIGSQYHDEAMGTAYFVRGFDYLFLVNQHGDIPLVTHASTQPEREYGRDPREEVYKQVISDLENAYQLLPEKPSRTDKLTKYAAAHYLACAHLWRASECNDDWNSSYKSKDLEEVIKWADIVIAKHPLVKDYGDLYANFTTYETSITETNSEIVLAASYTVDPTERGNSNAGNMGLCWFGNKYDTYFPGFCERDVAGGRPYQRLKNTPKYTYFVYDLENDSRFWKSFKTTWAINKIDKKSYTVGDGSSIKTDEYYGAEASEATFSKYLAAMYVINSNMVSNPQIYHTPDIELTISPKIPQYKYKDYNTGMWIPWIKVLLAYDSADQPETTSLTPNKDGEYPQINKYLDGAVNAYNAAQGQRNQTIARSAEDYFFKAEALIRQGKYNEGFQVLQTIRERAQYKAGEARDEYHDGGESFATSAYRSSITKYVNKSVFYGKNSYFYSVGGWDKDQAYRDAVNAQASVLPLVTTANYPKEDQYVMDFLAQFNPKYKSDEYTRAMCFLLDEKSREFYGEYKRYNDLVRTRTLADRLQFNDQCMHKDPTDILGHHDNGYGVTYTSPNGENFKPEKHYLRPIPQDFLEKITRDGHVLTPEDINLIQNPGY